MALTASCLPLITTVAGVVGSPDESPIVCTTGAGAARVSVFATAASACALSAAIRWAS